MPEILLAAWALLLVMANHWFARTPVKVVAIAGAIFAIAAWSAQLLGVRVLATTPVWIRWLAVAALTAHAAWLSVQADWSFKLHPKEWKTRR